MFDFRHCNYREIFRNRKIAGKEQTECTEVKTDLPNSRTIISTPATWKIITVNRGNDDHETLEPHTDIYDYTHEESDQ